MTDRFHASEGAQCEDRVDEQPPPSSAMEAVTRRFMRYLGDEGSSLNGVWVLIVVVNLGVMAVSTAIQYQTGIQPFKFEMMQDPQALRRLSMQAEQINYANLLMYPLIIVMLSLYYCGFRPMWVLEKEGPESLDFGRVRSELFANFGKTSVVVFLYLLGCGLGGMCCLLPGLIFGFIFLPAPYAAAVIGLTPGAAFTEALAWVKRHWLLITVGAAVSVLMSVFIVAIYVVATPVFLAMFGDLGILVTNAVAWLLGSIVGYFGWLFTGSVYVTIDLAEQRFG